MCISKVADLYFQLIEYEAVLTVRYNYMVGAGLQSSVTRVKDDKEILAFGLLLLVFETRNILFSEEHIYGIRGCFLIDQLKGLKTISLGEFNCSLCIFEN